MRDDREQKIGCILNFVMFLVERSCPMERKLSVKENFTVSFDFLWHKRDWYC